MTKTFTLTLLALLLISFTTTAQEVEQVSVGAGYTQQAYYNLSTGDVTQIANDAWDIAFSNVGMQDAGILINESASFGSEPVYAYLSTETDWANPITDTSAFVEGSELYNPEAKWSEGAFNTVKDPSSPLDYGWGAYNPSSHIIEGNKIFVIKKRDGSFIKFQCVKLTGGEYTFRYANLDGSEEVTAIASKNEAGNNPLIYFSFDNGGIEAPTDYDLVFQRYNTPIDAGGGELVNYNVTGVLLGPDTEAVAAIGVDPTTVDEEEYADQYSTELTTIGYDWKSFSFSDGWNIPSDRAYFVKTKSGEKYKIVFFDFEGSSTGITTLEKTNVGTVSTDDELNGIEINVYPNPTTDYININGIDTDCRAMLINNQGKVIINQALNTINDQINVSDLNAGIYNLTLLGNTETTTHTIVVTK